MVGTACGGGTGPAQPGVPLGALLVLPRIDSTFAPAPTTFFYHNNVLNTFTFQHPDGPRTLFATFTFAPHSIVAANGKILADTSTVFVNVSPTPGEYGFTLSPSSMVLNISGEPTVTVAYGTYGDFSVFSQSPKYATAPDYEQALALWRENTADHWVPGRNSAHVGTNTVTSALESPGRYVIAAPK